MATQTFGMAAIAELDSGRMKVAIDQRIEECAADVDDRGADGLAREADGLAREVTIKIVFTPQVSAGVVHDIKTEIVCHAKVPPRTSRPYSTMFKKVKGVPSFVINEASPDNVKQRTLDEAERQ